MTSFGVDIVNHDGKIAENVTQGVCIFVTIVHFDGGLGLSIEKERL